MKKRERQGNIKATPSVGGKGGKVARKRRENKVWRKKAR